MNAILSMVKSLVSTIAPIFLVLMSSIFFYHGEVAKGIAFLSPLILFVVVGVSINIYVKLDEAARERSRKQTPSVSEEQERALIRKRENRKWLALLILLFFIFSPSLVSHFFG